MCGVKSKTKGRLSCSATEWETAGEWRRSAGVQAEELPEVERRTIDLGGTAQRQRQETGSDCTGRCEGQERRQLRDIRAA